MTRFRSFMIPVRDDDLERPKTSTMAGVVERLAVALALVAAACGGDNGTTEPPPPPTPVPTSIQPSATTVFLRMGQTQQLTATVLDQQGRPMSGQSIAWSSSDTTKVTVESSGLARGVRPGTAAITAASGSVSANVAATVPAPALVLEPGASVSTTIGSGGGAISAQATSGARFTLTIPPLALADDVSITLTPIVTVENLPVGAHLIAAVRMQPDGLAFLQPASLAMDVTTVPSGTSLFGVRFADTGSPMTLAPISVSGTRLTMSIAHFSGGGAIGAGCPANIPLAGTAREVALAELANEHCEYQFDGSWDGADIVNILHKWYVAAVKPGLQAMPAGNALNSAFGEFADWRHTIDQYLPIIGPVSALNADVGEAKPFAVAVVKAEIVRLNQKCIADEDLAAAAKVFFWQLQAQNTQLVTSSNGLDMASVKAAFCLKLEIEQTDFPTNVEHGMPATLKVKAGLRFGTGALVYTKPLNVKVTATGATPATAQETTGATGEATFLLTPTNGSSNVHLDIRVELGTLSLAAYGVTKDGVVDRQVATVTVTLTPTAAIVNSGSQVTFTATVTGSANPNVTWSWTGSPNTPPAGGNTVVYTAGTAGGQYSITARSVAHPTRFATATIHILTSAGGRVNIRTLQRQLFSEVIFSTNGSVASACNDNKFLEGVVPPWDQFTTATCSSTTSSNRSGSSNSSLSSSVSGGNGNTASMSASFAGSNNATASSNPIDTHLSHTFVLASAPTTASLTFDVLNASVQYTVSGSASGTGDASSRQECARVQVMLIGNGVSRQEDAGIVCTGGAATSKPPANINWTGTLSPGTYNLYISSSAEAYGGSVFNQIFSPTKGSATSRAQFSIVLSTSP